ncbi:MAG: T9SS type A sorting domain-containing protein [Candidatus Cloacimonetes bacterium]|nr:T9SS type A sorting domain-containing protein [Candidatus Cloacimonadota bacterium]
MPGLVLSASPNPVQSGQLLKLKAPISVHAELKIYNLKGELLTKENMNGSDIAISTKGLANGCYFYKLSGIDYQGNTQSSTGKFIILK